MSRFKSLAVVVLSMVALSGSVAHAGVFIGVGVPGPYYRPYYRHYYRPYYYGPRVIIGAPAPAVYVAPAPVYVAPQPAPVYVQPAPTVIQATPTQSNLPVAPVPVNNQ